MGERTGLEGDIFEPRYAYEFKGTVVFMFTIPLGIAPSKHMMDDLLHARPGAHGRYSSAASNDDSSPDRGINFTMFLTMMSERLFEFDTEAELLEAFECFDEDDTGMVKTEEMRKWLSEVGERMDQREVCDVGRAVHRLAMTFCRSTNC